MGFINNGKGMRSYSFGLLSIVVVLVAVAGLIVYNHAQKPSTKLSKNVTDGLPSSSPSDLANANQTASTANEYIDIKEWGVKASYSGTPALTYIMSSDGKSAVFSSNQLTAASSSCTGRGGAILRWASTDKVTAVPADPNAPTATQYFASASSSRYAHIGDYYYIFEHDSAACGDPSSTSQAESQTNNAVQSLIQSLQSDSTASAL